MMLNFGNSTARNANDQALRGASRGQGIVKHNMFRKRQPSRLDEQNQMFLSDVQY